MNKLSCLIIFLFAINSSIQAQNLNYQLYNASTSESWIVSMFHDGFNGHINSGALVMPGTYATGTVGPYFKFPLEWIANSTASCSTQNVFSVPTPLEVKETNCSGVVVTYSIAVIIPFVAYHLKMQFE